MELSSYCTQTDDATRIHTACVSIVIVNWHSKNDLRKCLQSIYAHSDPAALEIIVVDGGSFDGCKEMLDAEFRGVRFIQCADRRFHHHRCLAIHGREPGYS